MRRSVRIALCVGLAAFALPAAGQTLRVAVSSPVTSIDPHYHNLAPNISLSTQIFNRLIEMDEHARLVPGLAASWKLVAPDTWELKLRDAKFQNGNAFVADDVVFTMDRIPKVPNSPSNFAAYTKPVTSTEVVDPHTIRLHTKGVFPLLPIYLAQFFIINRKTDEGMATEDFNSGKAAIGTGPFRFVSFKPGDRVELERNDSYWGPKPVWQKVTYRFIAERCLAHRGAARRRCGFHRLRAHRGSGEAAQGSEGEAVGDAWPAADLPRPRSVARRAEPVRVRAERREAGQEPAEGPARAPGACRSRSIARRSSIG